MEGARKAENRARLAVLQPHAAAEQIAQGGVRDAALPGKFRLGQAPGAHQLIRYVIVFYRSISFFLFWWYECFGAGKAQVR